MKENNLVVQHNKLIESRYKLSITEQRLIKLLISMIEPHDEDFKQYEIRVADLASLLDIKGGDVYLAIDKAVDRLMDAPIKFYDGDDKVKVRWLSSSRYQRNKGLALLRFDPELKPFLLQLKEQFTSYQLVNIIKLKHIYSIRIYELLKQYERIGRRRFSVEALRSVLMVGEGEYRQYRDFRRWVLKVAQKELAEKTDISFEWIEERTKRTCVAIEFTIKPRKQSEGAVAADIRAAQPEAAKEESPIVAQLAALGVARQAAERLAQEHGEDRILEQIAYAEARRKEGKLKNLAGFVVKAVKDGYRDGQAEERGRQRKAAGAAAAEAARRKAWEALKARWGAWRTEQAEARIAALEPEALEREKAAFRASLAGNFALARLVGKSARNEALHFRIHVEGGLPGLGLEDWARAAGADLAPFRELARAEACL